MYDFNKSARKKNIYELDWLYNKGLLDNLLNADGRISRYKDAAMKLMSIPKHSTLPMLLVAWAKNTNVNWSEIDLELNRDYERDIKCKKDE